VPAVPTALETHRNLDPERLGDHVDRLYRAALGLCRSPHEAEDLVQETYARVLARPRRLRNADELGYLLRTMRNTFVDIYARRRRLLTSELDEEVVESAPVAGVPGADATAEAHDVLRAVAGLPAEFRDVLVAVDLTGLSYAETASALDIPAGTVMSRLYRARERVARLVA
jgi:RNA polymerase sigma-70 factor (ECF subfamily)